MQQRLTVVVADDSALYRQMLLNVLRRIDGVEVVAVAADGQAAVETVLRLRPDVVTLDVHMPLLDGIGVLRALRAAGVRPRVIMVSSLTGEGTPTTVEALLEGAFDYILKPTGLEPHRAREAIHAALTDKLATVRDTLQRHRTAPAVPASPPAPRSTARAALPYDAIAIGCSTGGPETLRLVIPRLPADLPVPVLVVQHMPPVFTATLASRLDEMSAISVVEAAEGMHPVAGRVYIAPGGHHLKVVRRNDVPTCIIDDSPPRLGCRPSFDVLLESMADVYGGRVAAVVLTGMGSDGVEGCCRIKSLGAFVAAQSAETCVVYGMPKSIVDRGLADAVMPPDAIGTLLADGRIPNVYPRTSERTSSAT